MDKIKAVFVVDVDDRIWGVVNYDRLKSAKRYQRLLSRMSKRYKDRFKDFHPIEVQSSGDGKYEATLPEQKVGDTVSIELKNVN